MTKKSSVELARALIGCAFRPQGRDPATGLDCVGLAINAFAVPSGLVRRDYRLRSNDLVELRSELQQHFRRVSPRQRRIGDLLLCRVSRDQLHFAVFCGESFIHADARLRRVVETPGPPPWKVIATYRRRVRRKRGS